MTTNTTQDLTPAERGTMRLALLGWEARCVEEAKAMRHLAQHFDKNAERAAQCERNAKASEAFAAEARAILDGGKL